MQPNRPDCLTEHLRMVHGRHNSSVCRWLWITSGKILCRKVVHSWIKCFRMKATSAHQLMGHLPSPELKSACPFCNHRVDYDGPFLIHRSWKQSRTRVKYYTALFICVVTNAIHIDLVSDLTTELFLGVLCRYISMSGRSHSMYSDNAMSFKGANKVLQKLKILFNSDTLKKMWTTSWEQKMFVCIILPDSPHLGDLGEAGIKSIWDVMCRVIGNSCLCFEEMSTILTQAEACLNSCPLCQILSNPKDPKALALGQFLIVGLTMTLIVQSVYTDHLVYHLPIVVQVCILTTLYITYLL